MDDETLAPGDCGRVSGGPQRARPVPEFLLERPFRGSEALANAWLTHRQLYGPRWQRVFRDVYVSAETELTHPVRAWAASVLVPRGVVTGRSAAWLWGVDVDGPDGALRSGVVEVTVPPGPGRLAPGIVVRRRVVHPDHVGCVPWMRDVPVTWPEFTALDVAAERTRSHVESVVVLDQFCETAPVTLAGLRRAGAAWTGPGRCRLQEALAAADGLAGSPPETRLRLGVHADGLPPPLAQYLLTTPSGRRVKRLDFAWPHLRLAVEYDGASHVGTSTRPEGAFHLPKDRRVLNEVQELGWRLYYVTAPDPHDMAGLVARIRLLLEARAAELGVPLG